MKKFKHEQLTDQFIELIENGDIKAGDRLPSLRTLSKQQGISLMTVYHAINTLQGLGYVESRPRSGYFARLPLKRQGFNKNRKLGKKRCTEGIDELVQKVYHNRDHESMVSLSMNTPSLLLLPTSKMRKSILAVNRKNKDACLQYGPIAGLQDLREQITVFSGHSGIFLDSKDLIITVGCMEAINLAIHACTQAGDKILIESPTYFGLYQAITGLGRIPVEVDTHFKTGINFSHLKAAVEAHQPEACLVVSNFSNPLGATIPDKEKEKIVQFLHTEGVTLIENDIYGELYYGKNRPRTCKGFDRHNEVIYCSSFSKSLAPGYRIGWIDPGKYYDKVFRAKVAQSVASPTLNQEIMAHFLKNGRFDLHLKRLRKQLHAQSFKYAQAVEHYFPEQTIVSRPEGGFVLWVELPAEVDTLSLFNKAIEHNVSFAPGQLFSLGKDLHQYLRISIGQPFDDRLENGIKVLGQLIDKEI